MRIPLLGLVLLFTAPAAADECDARTAEIMSEVGGAVRSRIGPAIKLRHPVAESFSVDCRGSTIQRVSGSKDAPGSVQPFARLIVETASLAFGVSKKPLAAVMLRCIRSAVRKAGLFVEQSD